MKRVMHLSKALFCALQPRANVAAISVLDPQDEEPPLVGWHDILVLRFFDVRREIEKAPGFTPAHAESVLIFLERVAPAISVLLIHCTAGVSRSAGIAKFVSEKYGVPVFDNFNPVETSTMYYNPRVYQILTEVDQRRIAK
jgi:hypothetical protein